jgi:hypothetical protein
MANNKLASQAGFYELLSMKIRPIEAKPDTGIEISQIITAWHLNESMFRTNITGSVNVLDAEGIIRTLPILGEEILTIEWRDFFGNVDKKQFFCYGVRDLGPLEDSSESILRYQLDFTSIEHLKAAQGEVRQSFSNQLISDMVQSVFDTYFDSSQKTIEIEPTVGNQTFALPTMTPASAMYFLARKAYGGEDSTNNYYFFETKDNFFFCTPEYLYKKYEDKVNSEKQLDENNLLFYTVKTADDNTPAGQLRNQQTVSGLSYGNPSNSINEINEGEYKTSMLEIDLLNRTTSRTITEYNDIIDRNKLDTLVLPHSTDFLDNKMPVIDERYVLKDYNVPGIDRGENRHYPFYREVINSKHLFSTAMSKYSINCTINGRNPLIPGMVIFLMVDLIEAGDPGRPDIERDGLYMITSVTNAFVEDEFKQMVTITKGGVSSTNDRSLFKEKR